MLQHIAGMRKNIAIITKKAHNFYKKGNVPFFLALSIIALNAAFDSSDSGHVPRFFSFAFASFINRRAAAPSSTGIPLIGIAITVTFFDLYYRAKIDEIFEYT